MLTTQNQLKRRYPYMFDGPNIGISIPRGWIDLFAQLCADIDLLLGSEKRGFHFVQCKEKFGGARWYWSMQGDARGVRVNLISESGEVTTFANSPDKGSTAPLHWQVDALVQTAAEKTRHTCIACAAPGAVYSDTGWMVTVCERHARDLHDGKSLNLWPEEEDQ